MCLSVAIDQFFDSPLSLSKKCLATVWSSNLHNFVAQKMFLFLQVGGVYKQYPAVLPRWWWWCGKLDDTVDWGS